MRSFHSSASYNSKSPYHRAWVCSLPHTAAQRDLRGPDCDIPSPSFSHGDIVPCHIETAKLYPIIRNPSLYQKLRQPAFLSSRRLHPQEKPVNIGIIGRPEMFPDVHGRIIDGWDHQNLIIPTIPPCSSISLSSLTSREQM